MENEINIDFLAEKLNSYYQIGSEQKDINAFVQCFAINYAHDITENGLSPEDITAASSIPDSYAIEIRKGMKMAKYVRLTASFHQMMTFKDEKEMAELNDMLSSIGRKAFVMYLYPQLKKNLNVSVDEIANHYADYAAYSPDAQRSRLSTARSIFRRGLVREALMLVADSARVEPEARLQAQKYCNGME